MSLKLYVWGEVDPPAYGGDTLVVLANNLREARELAHNAIDFGYGSISTIRPRTKIDVSKTKPSMVIDKPDALYCWWAE